MGEERTAYYDQHSDDELREGVTKTEPQEPRIAGADSDMALAAQRRQRGTMEHELERRGR